MFGTNAETAGAVAAMLKNLREAQKKWNTRRYVAEAKSLIGIALLALKDHDFLVNNRIAHNETEKVFVASKKHIEEFKK